MTQINSRTSDCNHERHVSCIDCRLSDVCLPLRLHLADVDRLNRIVQRKRPLQKNQYIYRTDEPFHSIYAIRSGVVKSTFLNDRGQEKIIGFYLPGELVGLDG